jgi:hypothetical protein
VLLPEEFEAGLPDTDLRAVALHECAHIRRRDPLVLELASLLRAVLFFHPLVWLACRQVSLLAEQAADDAVLDATGEPVAYAKMLARLAEELRRRSLTTELAAGIVLSKSAFLRRVEAILSDRRDSLRTLSRRALALTILAVLLSLFLASALPLSDKGPTSTTQGSEIPSRNAAGGKEAPQTATGSGAGALSRGEEGGSAGEAHAAPGGGVLRYRHGLLPLLQQEVGYLGGRELKPATEKPEVKAEPTYAGTPVYFLIELGEKGSPPYVVAYDPKGGGGQGAVYFDRDQDGDLAEEEPLVPEGWGGTDNFGPIAVKLKRDGFVGLCHFWMERQQLQAAAPASPGGAVPASDRWSLRPGCYNVGEITFEGKTYKAATVDAFTNGRFNDICWANMSQGDLLLVDWNGDGKFDVNADEYVMAGERYWRNGKWYRPSFSADGTEVSFAPGDFELAPLLTGQEKFWMQVTSQSNTGSVQIEGTGGRVDLPVDQYSLYLCWVEAKDVEGKTWKAEAMTGGPYPRFEVKAGEENRYAFGPPFTVSLKASPEGSYQPGQTIRFQATFTGAEGKIYSLTRDGGPQAGPRILFASGYAGTPPGPKVVLKDESGMEVGSFQMQSGYPGGSGRWTVPENVKGKLTATASMDAGPFAWKAEPLVLEVR